MSSLPRRFYSRNGSMVDIREDGGQFVHMSWDGIDCSGVSGSKTEFIDYGNGMGLLKLLLPLDSVDLPMFELPMPVWDNGRWEFLDTVGHGWIKYQIEEWFDEQMRLMKG